ncbi:MAG: YecA family protein [Endozoicomonas sp.]
MQNIRSTLERLLEQYAVEDALTFHGIHGFLTAQAICPAELSEQDRNEIIFDGKVQLSGQDTADLNTALEGITRIIDRDFNGEEGFFLSCEGDLSDPEDDDLIDWCGGFMEGHFQNEDDWFTANEQEVCELLLPVMLASGFFDDEAEFQEILKDPQLTEDMCSQIPEVLMELYLLFNVPEESAKGGKKGGHSRRK